MKTSSLFLSYFLLSSLFVFAQDPFENPLRANLSNNLHTNQVRQYNDHIVRNQGLAWGWLLGVHIEFAKEGQGSFRLFSGVSVVGNASQGDFEVLGSIQSELELFRGGLGASILKSQRDRFVLEWRNTFQATFGGSFDNIDEVWARPLTPTIGQAYSTLYDPLDMSLHIGTSVITNFPHARNQQIGFLKVGILPLDVYYMNDGPPFSSIFLSDTYDRFWTGVGGAGLYWIHQDFFITDVELRYTRYTGDEPMLYEVSNKLKLDYLFHRDRTQQFLNKGRYQYRIGIMKNIHTGWSIYQPKKTDVQDLIHRGTYTLHSNPTNRYIGLYFDYFYKTQYLTQYN